MLTKVATDTICDAAKICEKFEIPISDEEEIGNIPTSVAEVRIVDEALRLSECIGACAGNPARCKLGRQILSAVIDF